MLTSRISSESYPGAQEYVVSCHGAGGCYSDSYVPPWLWVVWGRAGVSVSVVVAWPVHQVPWALCHGCITTACWEHHHVSRRLGTSPVRTRSFTNVARR